MVLRLFFLLFVSSDAWGFVFLSGPTEARLPVSEANPRIVFQLSVDPPKITGKDEFMDGAYADLSDTDFWLKLVELAMEPWNAVADAYVEMDVQFYDQAELNPDDGIFSLVVGKTNLTTAAFADPSIVDGTIADCDIAVSERGSSAKFMAFTLLHELGHCLGLGHNHSDYSAVMGYSRTDRSLNLGLDDEAGLVYLYPLASVGKPRELAGCGVLTGVAASSSWPLAFFLAPLVLPMLRRRPRLP